MGSSAAPPLRPRHPVRTALIAAVLAGLIGGVWYWSDHLAPPSAAPGAEKKGRKGAGNSHPQPVSVAAARKTDIRVWLNALGTVTPVNRSPSTPRSTARCSA